MKALASNIRTKIAAMLPRLATNHDGEVVATARAIGRTLAGAGADWHDLAGAITGETKRGSRADQHGGRDEAAVLWQELSWQERREWIDALLYGAPLTEWEFSFCESLRRQWLDRGRLSTTTKQNEVLNKLLWKALSAGVSP